MARRLIIGFVAGALAVLLFHQARHSTVTHTSAP
jgi:hypothetical protein